MLRFDRDKFDEMLNWAKKNILKELKVNFDALHRELIHAVESNIDPIDKEVYAPCDFVVLLAQQDADKLTQRGTFALYQSKLQTLVSDYIKKKNYKVTGMVKVRLEADTRLDPGFLKVEVAFEGRDHQLRKTVIRPPAESTLAYFEVLNGSQKGQKIPLTKGKGIIGRIVDDNHPDIGIEDTVGWVGRKHAEIEKRGGGFFIRDLNSTNGTRLLNADGTTMQLGTDAVALENGIVVLLADEYRLKFSVQDRLETQIRIS